jgi:hypothetical protein
MVQSRTTFAILISGNRFKVELLPRSMVPALEMVVARPRL